MNRARYWIVIAVLVGLFSSLPARSVLAATNSISVTLTLDDLPQMLTLCRDSNAIKTFGVDEEWDAFIDVDGNSNTGANGFDVELTIDTLPQNYPCTATSANTQQSLVASVAVWDTSQSTFLPSDQTAVVIPNFTAKTLTITTDVSGALANLNTGSTITVQSVGPYTPSAMTTPTLAQDIANTIVAGTSTTDPMNDVEDCSAPCSTTVAWYPLIDLTGFSVSTTSALPAPPPPPPPPPPYGANTVDVEFDLASLPTSVTLCDSTNLHNGPGYDIMWVAGTNYDTGLGACLTLIAAHTPLEDGCASPVSAPLASSLLVNVFQLDPNNPLNGYTNAADLLSVSADTANNKILVQLNYTDSHFATLSSSALAEFTVENVASSAQGDFPGVELSAGLTSGVPRDQGAQFSFGSSFVDPINDVCTMSGCTSASYPVIDLVSGSVHRDDYVFRNGFEQ
jgi:hypothetical protein